MEISTLVGFGSKIDASRFRYNPVSAATSLRLLTDAGRPAPAPAQAPQGRTRASVVYHFDICQGSRFHHLERYSTVQYLQITQDEPQVRTVTLQPSLLLLYCLHRVNYYTTSPTPQLRPRGSIPSSSRPHPRGREYGFMLLSYSCCSHWRCPSSRHISPIPSVLVSPHVGQYVPLYRVSHRCGGRQGSCIDQGFCYNTFDHREAVIEPSLRFLISLPTFRLLVSCSTSKTFPFGKRTTHQKKEIVWRWGGLSGHRDTSCIYRFGLW
jgi:hypothetical protein